MSDNNRVTVNIMGKSYHIVCPPEQADGLQEAAHYLNQKLNEIQQRGRYHQQENINLMAALNISHELRTLKHEHQEYSRTLQENISQLQRKLDDTIIKQEEIEL